jgi:hypothetical protein
MAAEAVLNLFVSLLNTLNMSCIILCYTDKFSGISRSIFSGFHDIPRNSAEFCTGNSEEFCGSKYLYRKNPDFRGIIKIHFRENP